MNTHTPGPWDNYGPIVHIGGQHIAHVVLNETNADGNRGSDEERANARLIAAAPELLEACEAVANDPYTTCACAEKVRAAIAKAKGEEK
jgi:hypothetical protein